jgi:hypothetical protein
MRRAFAISLLISLVISLSAYAAPPVPDPRLEQTYNTQVVPNIHRSVEFDRTIPPPAAREKPQVQDQDAKQVADGVFVDRGLLPPSRPDEPGVIRVFPSSSSGGSAPPRPQIP